MARSERLNFLLITTDQQRGDAIGYANPLVKTPNIDALAADGVRFDRWIIQNGLCMPSRSTMLTGRYPHCHGVRNNGITLPESGKTIAHVLSDTGYHCANIGKLHLVPHTWRDHLSPHPSYGFRTLRVSDEPGVYDDEYVRWVQRKAPQHVEACRLPIPWQANRDEPRVHPVPAEFCHAGFVTDVTMDFLRRTGAEPFFAIAGYYDPHSPFQPPEPFASMYDPADMPLPLPAVARGSCPERVYGAGRHKGKSDDYWRLVKAYYYAMISYVDDGVGRLMGELRRLGLADNTCVIFTSDHGEFLGDYELLGKGEQHCDCVVRTPLVMWCPSRFGSRRVEQVVETINLLPTICDLAAVEAPAGAQGWSMVPLMEGGRWDGPDDALIEGEWEVGGKRQWNRTMRDARYRLTCYSHGDGGELYDLQEDPHELKNLWSEPTCRDQRDKLLMRLMQRMMQSEDPLPPRIAPY